MNRGENVRWEMVRLPATNIHYSHSPRTIHPPAYNDVGVERWRTMEIRSRKRTFPRALRGHTHRADYTMTSSYLSGLLF